MKRLHKSWRWGLVSGLLIGMFILLVPFASLQGAQGFKPGKPVEFTIMAGTGGGADIYARFITGVIEKNKDKLGVPELTLLPTNRSGGAGATAMDFLTKVTGDAANHTIAISLDSFLMTPLVQGLTFSWRDFKGISLLALDNFFLWVHTDDNNTKWKTPQDFIKEAKESSLTAAGTGSKQEDELVIVSTEKAFGLKSVKYVPFNSGGEVATALVGKQVQFTVNNPSECLPNYPGKCKPLWTFAAKRHVKDTRFKDLPTMKELGIDFSYQMIRAVFGPPAMSDAAVAYYRDVMKKVFALDEFQKFFDTEVLDDRLVTNDSGTEVIALKKDQAVTVTAKGDTTVTISTETAAVSNSGAATGTIAAGQSAKVELKKDQAVTVTAQGDTSVTIYADRLDKADVALSYTGGATGPAAVRVLAKFIEDEALKRCQLMVQAGWTLKKKEPNC